MLGRKRRLGRQKSGKKRLLILLGGVLILLGVSASGYFLYSRFFPKPALYISPLARHPGQLLASIVTSQTQAISGLLTSHHIPFDKISAQNQTIFVVQVTDEGKVLFTTTKDLSSQVTSLQLILERLTMEGKHFSRLDFRYMKPVIVLR